MVRPSVAGTAVIANRTSLAIEVSVGHKNAKAVKFRIAAGATRPVRIGSAALLSWQGSREYEIRPDAAYYLGATPEGLTALGRIDLTMHDQAAAVGAALEASSTGTKAAANRVAANNDPARKLSRYAEVTVKILVDEEEPAATEAWKKRLGERIERCSRALEQHCFTRLKVVAYGTFKSDNATSDFVQSLGEFEREVSPEPARLAIGFTSQYKVTLEGLHAQVAKAGQPPRGRTHLGGTRTPLQKHLLIREWSQVISEPEREEVLLHELGHFMGAAHSPERTSVMRPVLGDRQSRSIHFRIGFDPLSALAMCLVSDQLREGDPHSLADLSFERKQILRAIYREVDRALPDDPAARQFSAIIDAANASTPFSGVALSGPKRVLAAVTATAQATFAERARQRLAGDDLFARYWQTAVQAAAGLPKQQRIVSLLLGLAAAVDQGRLVGDPMLGEMCKQLESDAERASRLSVVGKPTLNDREDLPQHFLISAALAEVVGPFLAESIGLIKELRDSAGGSGFSFVDYQADLAGIAMRPELDVLLDADELAKAVDFDFSNYLPNADDLPEGLTAAEFAERYGSLQDQRFLAMRGAIQLRLKKLASIRSATN